MRGRCRSNVERKVQACSINPITNPYPFSNHKHLKIFVSIFSHFTFSLQMWCALGAKIKAKREKVMAFTEVIL